MSEKFLKALKAEDNFTTTENMATALKSTTNSLVDLFGQIGALRNRNDQYVESAFSKAFAEDKLLATKMAFYARNIRGGLGERKVFYSIMKFLATIHPEIVEKNIEHISNFGRWDDLYVFVGTPAEDSMWKLVKIQWKNDIINMNNHQSVSLLAKWLKSVNASSANSKILGKLTARKLGITEKEYRKTLSALRKYIDVVEVKMSKNEWNIINYSNVPSRAMSIYRNAFMKHDKNGFEEYIDDVKIGKQEIKASTLYPYDILEKMGFGYNIYPYRDYSFCLDNYDEVLEEQWKALPNYTEGENNILIMADTSGSMIGRPMNTSIGLAIYFAERNKGIYKNKFMTFSRKPSFVELKGESLYEKVKCIPEIVDNTDLEKAFKLILDTAVKHKLNNKDMPKSLVIISDMQFDAQTSDSSMTWHDVMAKMFVKKGYVMPNIVYWNVDSRRDSFQVTSEYKGVQLASGQSPSVFKTILNNIGKTPYEAMINTLNDPMYDNIVV